MDRHKLAKRYRSLWTGEAASILLFVTLFLYYALADGQWRNWIVRTYSLTVVIFILLQGVAWWMWKLRILKAGQRMMPTVILKRFALFRQANWFLICLFPLVFILKWLVTNSLWSTKDVWLGSLFLVGALLEQINYYYYQLMYDNRYDWAYLRQHRRLRRGSIGKALAQMRE
jgi:hypothetical protein